MLSWKGISLVVVNVVVGVASLRDATRSPREGVGGCKGIVVKEGGERGFLMAVNGCVRAAKSARVRVGGHCRGVVKEGGLGSVVRCRLFLCRCACCNSAFSSSSMLCFWCDGDFRWWYVNVCEYKERETPFLNQNQKSFFAAFSPPTGHVNKTTFISLWNKIHPTAFSILCFVALWKDLLPSLAFERIFHPSSESVICCCCCCCCCCGCCGCCMRD